MKREFLKLLETDEEFRLAVAAKLGLLEILNELKKLREDFNKLYEKNLEHDKRFEAIEKKLEELISVVKEHGEAIDELASQITALGNRYGICID